MDWATIIVALIGSLGGGWLISLLTLRQTKKGKDIENKQKEDERWSKLCDEQQDQIEDLNVRLEKKDARIMDLEDQNANLHKSLNEVSTDRAICKILRCDVTACKDRKPPLGFKEVSIEDQVRDVTL